MSPECSDSPSRSTLCTKDDRRIRPRTVPACLLTPSSVKLLQNPTGQEMDTLFLNTVNHQCPLASLSPASVTLPSIETHSDLLLHDSRLFSVLIQTTPPSLRTDTTDIVLLSTPPVNPHSNMSEATKLLTTLSSNDGTHITLARQHRTRRKRWTGKTWGGKLVLGRTGKRGGEEEGRT